MTIKLIAIGKTDHKNLQVLIDEYQKRLSFYIKFELEIIPDIKKIKVKIIPKNHFANRISFVFISNTKLLSVLIALIISKRIY